jgi:hypothetical protein
MKLKLQTSSTNWAWESSNSSNATNCTKIAFKMHETGR